MKKLLVILALAVLLVPGIIMAQPPGCNWSGGDPGMINGWEYTFLACDGINYSYLLPGMTHYGRVRGFANGVNGMWNGFSTSCYSSTDTDTFCYVVTSKRSWTITTAPALGLAIIRQPQASMGYLDVWIDVPPGAAIGTRDTVIVKAAYYNTGTGSQAGCAPQCGDPENPNYSATFGLYMYNADTLIIQVIESPLTIEQDSITYVDQGQTQAYIPFDLRNWSADDDWHYYTISNTGTVGGLVSVFDSIIVAGDDRETVFLAVDAGTAAICDWDELTIIAWREFDSVMYYDTCVQLIHVIEPRDVPLFTVPVVTILVLALILAAAVFMRRRAVSKA